MITTRSGWGARAPRGRTRIPGPVAGVAVHYEGVNLGNYAHDSCIGRVRTIQGFHMDHNGWDDIAYSAVVCRHGEVFAGRGPGIRTAANGTNDGNARYYAVCVVMGPDDEVTPAAIGGLLEAIEWLRSTGGAGPEIRPHRSFLPTGCPGSALASWCVAGAPHPAGWQPPVSAAGAPAPAPGISNDPLEDLVAQLPTIDLRNAANAPIHHYLVDNIQGLLAGTQNGECNPGPIDGVAGGRTQLAVIAFQRMKGLTADGIVGPATWRALITH